MMNLTSTHTTVGARPPASIPATEGADMVREAAISVPDPARPWLQRGQIALDLLALNATTGRSPFGLSFVRHIDVPYESCIERLTALADAQGAAAVGRSRLAIPIEADAARPDRLHIDVGLGRGLVRARLAMDLTVAPWSPAFGSVLELHPVRGLRADSRYYREGNALLDRLTAVITAPA
jgi:hypothetical protein